MFRPTFRIMGRQDTVIIEENRDVHLTGDGLSLYTRFRPNNVSRSGCAAVSEAVPLFGKLLARTIWFVRIGMAVRPIEAFLSRGTPFADLFSFQTRNGFQGWFLGV